MENNVFNVLPVGGGNYNMRDVTTSKEEQEDFVPDTQPILVVEEEELQMSTDDLRKKVIEIKDHIEGEYTELCRLLWFVNKKRHYEAWGFSTFKEYVAQEVVFKRSKAMYLIQIWENLYHKQADKTVYDRVMKVGWSKAKELVHVVNAENCDHWVEKASHLSVEDLTQEVKKYIKSLIPDDPKEALEIADSGATQDHPVETAMKSITFQFEYQDYLSLSQAIETMKMTEPDMSNSQAVAAICKDFMATNQMQEGVDHKANAVAFIAKYEKLLGVKVIVLDDSDILHGYDHLKDIAEKAAE